MCALGAAVLAVGLTARLAATTDSIEYLFAARSLLRGDGLLSPTGGPFIQYAPLYPLAIAAVAATGLDPVDAARAITVVLVPTWVLLAGIWAGRLAGSRRVTALAGVAAVLVAPAMLGRVILSENLVIALLLAGGLLLALALQRRSPPWLVAAGGVLGLAAATRWAALPMVLVGAYVFWAWPARSTRARAALVYVVPCAAVTAVPLVRNRLASGGSLPGTPEPGRSLPTVVGEAVRGVTAWWVPTGTPPVVRVVVAAAAAALLVGALVLLRGQRSSAWWRTSAGPFVVGGLYLVSTVASALMTSIGSLTSRLLTPCYPLFTVGAVSLVWSAGATQAHRLSDLGRRRTLLAAGLLPVLVIWAAAGATVVRYGTALHPRERLGPEVVGSPLLASSLLRSGQPVISNDPVDAAWAIGAPVAPLPGSSDEVEALADQTGGGPVLLAWSDVPDTGAVALDGIERACQLTQLATYDDGAVFRMEACRT